MKSIPISLFTVLLLLFNSCQTDQAGRQTSSATTTPDTLHNARNSLDYFGTYEGVLPCADCEGVETAITIAEDSSFVMTRKYLGESDELFTDEGTYRWNDQGNTLIFSGPDMSGRPGRYVVGENMLVQLDMEGNRITGELSEHYILAKSSGSGLPLAGEPSSVTDARWVLTELNGEPAESLSAAEPPYITFDEEESIMSGFAGCNNISGDFHLAGESGISFTEIISTKKACPDMEIEPLFLEMLENTENYTVNENGYLLLRTSPDELYHAVFRAGE